MFYWYFLAVNCCELVLVIPMFLVLCLWTVSVTAYVFGLSIHRIYSFVLLDRNCCSRTGLAISMTLIGNIQ